MTDKEIIKALECCMKPTSDCDNCPFYAKGDGDCVDKVKRDALDLINLQQAEIERFKIENQSLRSAANSYKIHYNEARAEAVKELIERLTKEYAHYTLDFTTTIDIFFCSVKRIAKEMIGDDNA